MTGAPSIDAGRAADADDPLGTYRGRFEIPDDAVCYLDGNSLGRPPVDVRPTVARLIDEWSDQLVEAWDHWIDRPVAVGDLLAPVLGAGPGQVTIGESTTVALYLTASAALDARRDRPVVVAATDDFPTDRYVVDGLAAATGRTVRWVPSMQPHDVVPALGDDVALLIGSAVNFESAAISDVDGLTAAVHECGGLVVWDCSHAAGAIPLHLDARNVDLAVGCTYKYLHGGPGSPAFVYVASVRQDELRQPIHGWFGQRDQFEMGPTYEPAAGIGSWRIGTPTMFGVEIAAAGIAIVAEAGIEAVRAKSLHLGHVLLDAYDAWFADLGLELGSPRDDDARGGHVALRHPDASRIVRAARAVGVIADFRAPDIVRLGPGPLATSFTELVAGLERLRDTIASGAHQHLPETRGRVT